VTPPLPAYSERKSCESYVCGISGWGSPTRRFTTPADFPRPDVAQGSHHHRNPPALQPTFPPRLSPQVPRQLRNRCSVPPIYKQDEQVTLTPLRAAGLHRGVGAVWRRDATGGPPWFAAVLILIEGGGYGNEALG
jgi:hypothetical protein